MTRQVIATGVMIAALVASLALPARAQPAPAERDALARKAREINRWLMEHPELAEKIIGNLLQRRGQMPAPPPQVPGPRLDRPQLRPGSREGQPWLGRAQAGPWGRGRRQQAPFQPYRRRMGRRMRPGLAGPGLGGRGRARAQWPERGWMRGRQPMQPEMRQRLRGRFGQGAAPRGLLDPRLREEIQERMRQRGREWMDRYSREMTERRDRPGRARPEAMERRDPAERTRREMMERREREERERPGRGEQTERGLGQRQEQLGVMAERLERLRDELAAQAERLARREKELRQWAEQLQAQQRERGEGERREGPRDRPDRPRERPDRPRERPREGERETE